MTQSRFPLSGYFPSFHCGLPNYWGSLLIVQFPGFNLTIILRLYSLTFVLQELVEIIKRANYRYNSFRHNFMVSLLCIFKDLLRINRDS